MPRSVSVAVTASVNLRTQDALAEEIVREIDAAIAQRFDQLRADAAGFELPARIAVLVHAGLAELENVLEADGVAFGAGDFGDAGDFSLPAGHAPDLHEQVQRAGGLLANGRDG